MNVAVRELTADELDAVSGGKGELEAVVVVATAVAFGVGAGYVALALLASK